MNRSNYISIIKHRKNVKRAEIKPIKERKLSLKVNRIEKSKLKLLSVKIRNKIPTNVSLVNKFPPVFDQGYLGSCTANAINGIIGYMIPNFIASRLFLYYNERLMINTVMEDSGAYLSDGIKCLQTYGVCSEKIWPYIINRFTVRPTKACYTEALNYNALEVLNIENDLITMKNALASGNPFVVGILIYDSFENSQFMRTYTVPMPNLNKDTLLGGHAVVIVGYNDSKQCWIMRNSWGRKWGLNGYCYLPYEYLLNDNLASDLWTILKMENGK